MITPSSLANSDQGNRDAGCHGAAARCLRRQRPVTGQPAREERQHVTGGRRGSYVHVTRAEHQAQGVQLRVLVGLAPPHALGLVLDRCPLDRRQVQHDQGQHHADALAHENREG
jgi:hypothetical protein